MSKFNLTIPTLLGTEQVVAFEVKELGYEISKVDNGSVSFVGDEEAIAVLNINLRAAERVMIKLASFSATTFDMLYEGVRAIHWEELLPVDAQFPVTGYALKSALHSVPDCQSIVKKAIVDRLSQKYGITARLEESGGLYPVRFAIMKDVATIYLDTSGPSLYKRGYREESVIAPMRETLAFSMISLSFWKGDRPFYVPEKDELLKYEGLSDIEAGIQRSEELAYAKLYMKEKNPQYLIYAWHHIQRQFKTNLMENLKL